MAVPKLLALDTNNTKVNLPNIKRKGRFLCIYWENLRMLE